MKSINWNQMSELGLIERINREILHPLGLAVSRDVETGTSTKVLVADDGVWEYPSDMQTTIISDEDVQSKLAEMNSDELVRLTKADLKEAVSFVSKVFVEMEDGESVIVIIDADNLPNVKEAHFQQAFCKENGITALYGKGIIIEDKKIHFFTTDRKTFAGYNGHTVVITSDAVSKYAEVMAAGISMHKRWRQYVVYINQDSNNDALDSELTITEKLESIHEYASMIPLHLTDENSHANLHIKHFVKQIKLHCQLEEK